MLPERLGNCAIVLISVDFFVVRARQGGEPVFWDATLRGVIFSERFAFRVSRVVDDESGVREIFSSQDLVRDDQYAQEREPFHKSSRNPSYAREMLFGNSFWVAA